MTKNEIEKAFVKIMQDLQKRVKNPRMYGEDWNVSYNTICNGKYEINIIIYNADNFSMHLGKKPYFCFKLMENETCTFIVEEKDSEVFISKVLEIVNK